MFNSLRVVIIMVLAGFALLTLSVQVNLMQSRSTGSRPLYGDASCLPISKPHTAMFDIPLLMQTKGDPQDHVAETHRLYTVLSTPRVEGDIVAVEVEYGETASTVYVKRENLWAVRFCRSVCYQTYGYEYWKMQKNFDHTADVSPCYREKRKMVSKQFFAAGYASLEARKLERAISLFDYGLSLDASSAEAFFYPGEALYQKRKGDFVYVPDLLFETAVLIGLPPDLAGIARKRIREQEIGSVERYKDFLASIEGRGKIDGKPW